jgi:serine/threonine protein kinase/tetratricopeptide (TPR) repeat protein
MAPANQATAKRNRANPLQAQLPLEHAAKSSDSRRMMGRYHILRLLGQGGMGAVYEAYDPELARKVAIKVLNSGSGSAASEREQEDDRLRLLREAKSLASVSHPNIVAIFDVGLVDAREVFLAMEHLEGESLRARWINGPLPWREVLRLMCQAGDGLAAAHAAGLIHRDFKPENIFVGSDDVVRVLDFGLARRDESVSTKRRSASPNGSGETLRAVPDLEHNGDEAPTERFAAPTEPPSERESATTDPAVASDCITQAGTILGTPRYMAPEQLRGEHLGPQADLFAFCVVIFEGICGRPPAQHHAEWRRANTSASNESMWPRGAPRWLRNLVLRGMNPDPSARGAGVARLLVDIRKHLAREAALQRLVPASLVTGISALAIGGVLVQNSPQIADECAIAGESVAALWSRSRQDQIARGFAGVGLRNGDSIWELTRRSLQTWTESLASERHQMCERAKEARTSNRAQALADIEISRSCLDDAQGQLAALLQVWHAPTRDQVLNAPGAVHSLSTPESCRDAVQVRALAPLPRDPDVRKQVLLLRRELNAAKVFVTQADFQAVEESLANIAPQVINLGDPALLSELLETQAIFEGQKRAAYAVDVPLLQRALLLAHAGGHWMVAARVAIQLSLTQNYMLNETAGRNEAMDKARALVSAAGAPVRLRWQLATCEAVEFCSLGDQVGGGELFAKALPLAVEGFGEDSPEHIRTQVFLGANAKYRGLHREAIRYFESAKALAMQLYGPTHPDVIDAHGQLAAAYGKIGALDLAMWHAMTGNLRCQEAGYPLELCADALEAAGQATLAAGELSEAQSLMMRAVDARALRGARTFPGDVWPQLSAASVLAARGDGAAAIELAKQGLARLQHEPNAASDAIALSHIIAGEVTLAAGNVAMATKSADEARLALMQPSELRHLMVPRLERLLGKLSAMAKRYDDAIDHYERALAAEIENHGSIADQALTHANLAESFLALAQTDAAVKHADIALDLVRAQSGLEAHMLVPYYLVHARTSRAAGDTTTAMGDLDAAASMSNDRESSVSFSDEIDAIREQIL